MSKDVKAFENFSAGIADFEAEGVENSYAFGRSIDHRTDPTSFKLLPRTIKESGTVVVDLIKWAETISGTTYMIGDGGNFYRRTSAGSYTLLRTISNNSGNGLGYFAEDDYIYYPGDKVIGRYGPIGGTPTFTDDFLGAQGGVPTNTASIDFESGSSMYASRADTASLSITGNISLETWVKPESLPTSGNSMTLISKWDQSGTLRSYKMDIAAVSGYFGDGSDGALTISANTTEAPIDSSCSGTAGTPTISATNASFAADQIVLVHQSAGSTGAGTWERRKILSYTAGTITLTENLAATYTDSGVSQAQVRVMKQYTNVTINSGITYTTKAWDGNVGGIMAFLANGTFTSTGTTTGTGKGFRGGTGTSGGQGVVGEDQLGNLNDVGAGGIGGREAGVSGFTGGGSGGQGAHATTGTDGANPNSQSGAPGRTWGAADLTTAGFGGAGGSGGGQSAPAPTTGDGGNGGGFLFFTAATITATGAITCNGGAGTSGSSSNAGGGGGGAGGAILLKAQTATLGASLVTASGGAGGSGNGAGGSGGTGGVGRIHLDYYTSYTGTTTPTLDVVQDNSLVTNTTYQLRLAVSSTGLNTETLTKEIASIQTALWQHLAVTWTASTSTATFYFNGVSLGTTVGTLTAIHNNTSEFFVATNKNDAGSAANFYDGLMDDARVWNTVRTATEIFNNMSDHVLTTASGLVANYRFESGVTDSQTSANNSLTASGSPTYSSDVPFSGATTRLDIDQSATTAGNTYTNTTSISETAANKKEFTPTKDPQKSIAILVAGIGTGAWTITVHDSLNTSIASTTITNANMGTGYQEFTFSTPWRPIINNTYHFHVTSTVADGTTTCTTSNDLSTVSYRTYYQFLVTDTEWHFAAPFLNFMVFGNERYLAKYEATLYTPHTLTFPAGWRARCYGYWREYFAIGMQKGSEIDDNDQGRIYFWDGTASTFNFFIDVPEGGINALLGSKGKLSVWAGYQGDMLLYQGGDSAEKIKRIPKITDSTTIEIFPGAVSMWKALLRFGVAGGGDSTVIQKGVYTYGSLNRKYDESLSYDYPISTSTLVGTSLKIGMVTVVNKRLLIAWQDNISYGVDYVDSANNPYSTGTAEFLVTDDTAYWHDKTGDSAVASFNGLNSGETVTIKHKLDEDASFTSVSTSTTDATSVKVPIHGKTYKQHQIAVDLATTTTTSPVVHSVAIKRDFLETSDKFE